MCSTQERCGITINYKFTETSMGNLIEKKEIIKKKVYKNNERLKAYTDKQITNTEMKNIKKYY
jgi:hypothetical protein